MIVIQGVLNQYDYQLLSAIKKFFEADEILMNWKGEQPADNRKTFVAITSKKPVNKTQHRIMSLNAVKRMLTTEKFHQREKLNQAHIGQPAKGDNHA